MSIRLRLTLLYIGILAVTLITFSTVLYVSQTHAAYDNIKTALMRQVDFMASPGGRGSGPRDGPPGAAGFQSLPPDASLPSGTLMGRWTQTRSITGTIIGQTLDLNGTSLPLSEKGLQAVQGGASWFETADVQDQALLIYSRQLKGQNGVADIVQVAFPITQAQQSLNALRLILVVGCGLVIVVAFAIGWVLAGTALRPIHRITSTAQAIGAERNFSHRVQHVGPTDEVGQLALTFNNMLAELESAYRQLEGALDSQRRFVADASHELRTPLTTVRGNVELLRREPPVGTEERTEILADTTDEVDRLIRLVNQLLALARADAGQPLRHDRVRVKPLLEDVYRQAKLLAPEAAILADPPPDVMVLGDRDALKQVLLILIDNAHVHTPAGTVIGMSTVLVNGSVVINVHDTGGGITPDVLPHIFERFYRGKVSRSGPGTGLGLAIAKELIMAQNGSIEVESELGQGTLFSVILPRTGA